MEREKRHFLKSFLIELVVYGVLVVAYFFLVLHFLGDWIKHVYDYDKLVYAFVALGLMLGQGVLLEMLTTKLLDLIGSRTE